MSYKNPWDPNNPKSSLFIAPNWSNQVKAYSNVTGAFDKNKGNTNAQGITGSGGYIGTVNTSSSPFEEILPPKNDKTTTGSIVKNTNNSKTSIELTPKGVAESWKGKKWGDMSKGEKFQAGSAQALKILDTIDMLTGGQDEILPGSGHTYSPKQDTSMYIGQGMGY